MKRVFADADYWIAAFNPLEELHQRALQVSRGLGAVRIVTSEMVLVEVLNLLGSRGAIIRAKAREMVCRLRESPNVTIIPQTSSQFADALSFFEAHQDKEWSMTDCGSILIMRGLGITDVLTRDHHFQQAGFVPLLRDPQ